MTETKGHALGLVVPSRGMAGNIAAGLRSEGGEITEYTWLLADTRRRALLDARTGERRYVAED